MLSFDWSYSCANVKSESYTMLGRRKKTFFISKGHPSYNWRFNLVNWKSWDASAKMGLRWSVNADKGWEEECSQVVGADHTIFEYAPGEFLATLVALHFTLVSEWVGHSFERKVICDWIWNKQKFGEEKNSVFFIFALRLLVPILQGSVRQICRKNCNFFCFLWKFVFDLWCRIWGLNYSAAEWWGNWLR